MTTPDWLPFAGSIFVQVVVFAFFAGGMRAELRFLKEQIKTLVDNQALTKVAVLEQRVNEHEGKFKHIDDRFEEAFRQLSALTIGRVIKPMAGE